MNQLAVKSLLRIAILLHPSILLAEDVIRVEVVSEKPTWSYRYLKDAFDRDTQIHSVHKLVDEGPAIRARLKDCSVLILMDVSPASIRRGLDAVQPIKEFVAQGGGLIFTTGKTWQDEKHPLEEMLPVAVTDDEDVAAVDAPRLSRPNITGLGLRRPLLRLRDNPMLNQQLWGEDLPPCFGEPLPVSSLRTASVFAVDSHRRINGEPIPLIAAGKVGEGRVVFLNTPELWRWRVIPVGNYHARLWRQLVQYAAGADER